MQVRNELAEQQIRYASGYFTTSLQMSARSWNIQLQLETGPQTTRQYPSAI